MEIPYNKPYKMSNQQIHFLRKNLDELFKKGYIRPSSSPWGSPALVVPKPHQPVPSSTEQTADAGIDPSKPHEINSKTEYRLVIDVRGLNAKTVRDKYTLPTFQNIVAQLEGCDVFSVADLINGYWNIPMVQEDIEKTAMTTPIGSWEWLVMPQGLTNAPSIFQRFMDSVLRDLSDCTKCFLDDILIYSKFSKTGNKFDNHTKDLERVFSRLRQQGIFVKASKLNLYQKSCKFLGHKFTAGGGIQPLRSKTAAIEKWEAPVDVSGIRCFLGLCNWYHQYIFRYTEKAKPLQNLLKKNVEFVWGEEQQKSFDSLKRAMVTAPMLIVPDQEAAANGSKPYVLITDVSAVGIGGVLLQDRGDVLKPIAYESKSLTPAQSNYDAGSLELL